MDAVDELIIKTIERITHPHTGAFERVYPRHVTEFLPVVMSVRTVRKKMSSLASAGKIHRIGYHDGYVTLQLAGKVLPVLEQEILETIERITHPQTGAFERVYPKDVLQYLPTNVHVRTLRERMARMARRGEILRLGDYDGYVCHDRGRLALEETLAKKLDAARALSLEITKLREMMLQVKVA